MNLTPQSHAQEIVLRQALALFNELEGSGLDSGVMHYASGALKDLLIDYGLKWISSEDRYVFSWERHNDDCPRLTHDEPGADHERGRADALRDAVAAVRAVTHEGSGVAKSFNGGVIAARAVLEKMR